MRSRGTLRDLKKRRWRFLCRRLSICGLQHIRQYLNKVVEQDHRRVQGRLRPMLGFKSVLQCATRDYRYRAGAEDSQTLVRNSDPMAVESRGDRASRHGRIVRIAECVLLVLSLRQSYLHQNPVSSDAARSARLHCLSSMICPPHNGEMCRCIIFHSSPSFTDIIAAL